MAKLFTALTCILSFCIQGPASASDWKVSQASELIIPTEGAIAPNGLPDGHVASLEGVNGEVSAWYEQPTKRYGHGILGDAIEAGSLSVQLPDGTVLKHVLPDNQVFEDRTPRLADLSGLGEVQIVTILSDADQGASIAVFTLDEDQLVLKAQTPFIGRSNRWRNVAGIADFDGDGKIQIAEVVTPHIGGTLRFWTWTKDALVPSGEIYGFSNHFIGSREQRLSTVEDFDDDGVVDLALPSAGRSELRIIGFSGKANGEKTINEIGTIALPARIDRAISSSFEDGKAKIKVGLDDGSIWSVHR